MLLAIDAGNTHIVIGCIEGNDVRGIARMETNRNKTEFEYAVTIERILRLDGMADPDFEGAVISSVVPPLTDTLCAAVGLITGQKALVVGAGLKTGLNIALDDPGTIGPDLVAAAVAALARYTPPLVIADMGTATTMTVIDAKKRLLGGAILPGVGVSVDTLSGAASLLPRIQIDTPKKCIGTNTTDCMKSGAVFGAASQLDGMIDRFEAELGSPVTVVATGGFSEKIVPYCRHKIDIDENLLLRGLGIIWEKNKKRP